VVTVEADLDGGERRLAAGELWCPSCGGGLGAGEAAAGCAAGTVGGAVSAPVAVHRVWGDACVVAGDRVAAPCRYGGGGHDVGRES
jgi:hypothetical protein